MEAKITFPQFNYKTLHLYKKEQRKISALLFFLLTYPGDKIVFRRE